MKLSLLSLVTFITAAVADLDPIVIKVDPFRGSKFFYSSNDTQFYLRGVAYQYSNTEDPLADATACERDVPLMKELRTNVIRTYYINPDADHTKCMQLLSDAGIYLISDLSSPNVSINRADPEWQVSLYSRYTAVIDELQQYNNTIGFFAGNEISNTVATTDASAYVKASVRDMKSYIKQKGYRSMGVGYATADVSNIRVNLANYLDCESDDQAIDFWGYNIYSWCGNSTYQESGYKARTEEFRNYTAPVFFAEYGCNEVTPREFTEVKALYGDTMAEVWSGGIVYMYFQESNDYGLVSVIDSTSVSKMKDFTSYSDQIASANPTGTNKASYTPTNTALQQCPTVATSSWLAKATPLPPTPDSNLCGCIYDESACVPADDLKEAKYGTLLGVVCGYTDCSGLNSNATTGKYGAYSMCGVKDQLAFALNKYYTEQDKAATACSFSGSATTKATTSATGTCSSQIKEAGTAGTGTVTTESTATAGSDSSSSSSTSSSFAVPASVHSSVSVGSLQVAAYVATALLAGIGMIAL
ncbi:hypothetical protein N7532_000046 [Penicillium argentinense]|uniref:1,3-beta-glucanosyltransferase n=1 Tax=Penicillium argentinense TaxID=1131581 RepID=A0A9W9G4H8_9EURO|nr:uncharacterized protein N7532_000046 [Penicillium argentinense]KAJ5112001.1 hypothetical protein N7532_000046 [Penicillium argentinense]